MSVRDEVLQLPLLFHHDVTSGVMSETIRNLIRSVPSYKSLADGDISYERLAFNDFRPLQRVLAHYKLQRARNVIDAHTDRGYPMFSPVLLSPSGRRRSNRAPVNGDLPPTLWLPPLVELHPEGFIVIDGHHRLYTLFLTGFRRLERTRVIVLRRVSEPLPATPVEAMTKWMDTVRVDDELYRRGRSGRYSDYDSAYWRDTYAIRHFNFAPE